MTATAIPTKPRKPRAKPVRKIRLIQALTAEAPGIIRIQDGKKIDEYFLDRIPSDFGEAYRMEKRDYAPGEEHRYEVCLDGRQSRCCCKGYLRHHHCRHIEGLTALKNAGKL